METTPTTSTDTKQMFSTPVAIVIAGALVAGALLYALVWAPKNSGSIGTNPDANQGTQAVKGIAQVTDKDHFRGDLGKAEFAMVEYSDLECPYCSSFHPVMKQLKEEYGDKVVWAYRHFPLSQIHPQALSASVASECVASAKGEDAFWRFIDGIYADQAQIGIALFKQLASKEGISGRDLDACIAKQDTAKIEAQYNEAIGAGGQGTPYTVILDKDGKTVGTFPGAYQYNQAKAQIDALLAS